MSSVLLPQDHHLHRHALGFLCDGEHQAERRAAGTGENIEGGRQVDCLHGLTRGIANAERA